MIPLVVAPAVLVSATASPPPGFDAQGHRGARGLAPENTLAGFERALEIGVTTLELDSGVTRDGVVVVSHDPRLNPDLTRDAAGVWLEAPGPALFSLTLAELRGFDVGRARPGSDTAARFPEQRPSDGQRIPTLAEVIALAQRRAPGMRFNIETKLDPREPELTPGPEAFAEALVAVLREAGILERSAIQSFDWRTLRHAARIAPQLERVCLTTSEPDGGNLQPGSPGLAGLDPADHGASAPRLVQAVGCGVWSPNHADLSPETLAEAHALGLRVVVWTVNQPDRIDELIGWGVDGIISDHPERLRAAMAARGLPLPPPAAAP